MGKPRRAKPRHSIPPKDLTEEIGRYYKPIYRWIRRRTTKLYRQDADDKAWELAGEVMISAIKNQKTYDAAKGNGAKDPLAAWLIWRARSILKRDFEASRRGIRDFRKEVFIADLESGQHQIAQVEPNTEEINAGQLRERVEEYLYELGFKEYECIKAVYFRGMTNEEAAAAFGMSPSLVGSHLHNAKKKLREIIPHYYISLL